MISSTSPDLVFPAGRIAGCLPRSLPAGRFPMASDRIKPIPSNQWDEIADDVGLDHVVWAVLDQGQHGSCACEAATQAVMIARELAGKPRVLLNPYSVYCFVNGGRDQGSSIDAVLAHIQEFGICPEDVWPRSKGIFKRPDSAAMKAAAEFRILEAWDIANVNEHVSASLRAFPVVFGAKGHAICCVRHQRQAPKIVNSWGKDWGTGGFGTWCSYNAINWGYGAWAVRV